jgi:uncharacterized protein (TIGR02271 family)
MNTASISARVESLREEIRLIQNQERFYQALKRDSFEQMAAHARRELRLLDIQTELRKLQRREHGRRKESPPVHSWALLVRHFATVTGERLNEARQIIQQSGGDLREGGFQTSASKFAGTTGIQGEQRTQLRGEMLRTYKERIKRGEVRLHKEVVTENQTVQVPVTREELVVERTPASGPAATAEIGRDQEVRVPLSEERVRVEKQPVVNEEVRVGKRPGSD